MEGSVAMVGGVGEDLMGAVELFEGDEGGEFVLHGVGAECPEPIGGGADGCGEAIGTADEEGDGFMVRLPLVDALGEVAAGEGGAVFVEGDAEGVVGGLEEGFGLSFGGAGTEGVPFDPDGALEALEIIGNAEGGAGEFRFADGEEEPAHGELHYSTKTGKGRAAD